MDALREGFGRLGAWLYGLAVGGLGLQALAAPCVMQRLAPGGVGAVVAGGGAIVLAAALGRSFPRARAVCAVALAALAWLAVAALHAPRLVAHPLRGGAWADAFVVVALGASALLPSGPRTPPPCG